MIFQKEIPLSSLQAELLRSSLYLFQKNIMPKKLIWDNEITPPLEYSKIARRLGLIPFKISGLNHFCLIINEKNEDLILKASDLNSKGKDSSIEASMPNEFLGVLKPGQKLAFELVFEEGCAGEHARFDLLEKRFISTEKGFKVRIVHPYQDVQTHLKTFLSEGLRLIDTLSLVKTID